MATHDNNMLDQDSQSQPWWWSPDGWLSATAPTGPAPQRDFVAGGSALHEVLQTTHSPTQQQLYEHSARHHLTSSTAMASGLQPHGYQSTHNQPPHMSRKPMVQPNAGGHWVWVPDCLPPKVSNHHPANLPATLPAIVAVTTPSRHVLNLPSTAANISLTQRSTPPRTITEHPARKRRQRQSVCPYPGCGRPFARAWDMRRHHATVHRPRDENGGIDGQGGSGGTRGRGGAGAVFPCEIQGCRRNRVAEAFTRKDHLKDHMRRMHPRATSDCLV